MAGSVVTGDRTATVTTAVGATTENRTVVMERKPAVERTINRLTTLIHKETMNNRLVVWLLGLSSLWLVCTGCDDKAVCQDSKMISSEGWRKNELVSFDFDLTDTLGVYNVLVDVRNDNAYPFQNFWLFIHTMMPDSTEFSDTLNCVLADNYGRWLGKSSGSMYHVPVAFRLSTKFPQAGKYHFDLVQGMRMDVLPGITEIGMRILKDGKE